MELKPATWVFWYLTASTPYKSCCRAGAGRVYNAHHDTQRGFWSVRVLTVCMHALAVAWLINGEKVSYRHSMPPPVWQPTTRLVY